MKKPHKHAELIKLWADGAEIELQSSNGIWMPAYNPDWSWPEGRYRIKPEPKPDVVMYVYAYKNCMTFSENQHKDHNLKLTLDATTNKLIKAEVI